MRDSTLRTRARGRGFAAEGKGFYVWDGDRREALRWALELRASRPTQGDGYRSAGPVEAAGAAPTAGERP